MAESYRNETATIGTSASVVSVAKAQSGRRRRLTLTNTSSGGQVITVSIDKTAVANQGFVLSPGGYVELIQTGDTLPPQSQVTAISNLANGDLAIYEEVI